MYLAFSLLVISALAMVIMLYIKLHEHTVGGYHWFPRWREKGDQLIRRAGRAFLRFMRVVVSKKFWLALGHFLYLEFRENVVKHPQVIKARKKAQDFIRGRKTIKSKGPVSFYLGEVTDHKDTL